MLVAVDTEKVHDENDLAVYLHDVFAAYNFCRDTVIYLNTLPKEVSDMIWELMKDYILAELANKEIDLSKYEQIEIIDVNPVMKVGENND